jgi:S1-C subfamily serine protease
MFYDNELKRLSLSSLFSGGLGGIVVVAVVLVVVESSGGLGSTTKTVTVVQSPMVPATASQQARGLAAHQIYERDAPGVVFVNATGVTAPKSTSELLKGEGGEQGASTGSGFELDGAGTILTNYHVIAGSSKITVGLGRGSSVTAQVIGDDPSDDLALLRIPVGGLTLQPLPLGDSNTVHVGDPVLAIGNPYGLERTLTTGIVSALARSITAPDGATIQGALQTDAPIDPGSSGGPLLNERGEVIGINSQIETSGSGGGYSGIAFAVPIATVKRELPALEQG